MSTALHASEQFATYFFTTESAASRPTGWTIALHTADPAGGDANEVSAAGYARKAVTFDLSCGPDYCEAVSDIDVTFDPAGSGASYTVTHFSVRNSGSGECLAVGQLPVPMPVVASSVISFPAGFIRVRGV